MRPSSTSTVWDGEDFTLPFRRKVLDGAIPLSLACLSFTILTLSYVLRRTFKILRRRRRRSKLIGVPSSRPKYSHGGGPSYGTSSDGNGHHDDDERPHGSTGSTTPEGQQPLPVLIIETEAEHEVNDSHDLMLEAENAVIRQAVKDQGIVWPGAFKALGLLKERENHHLKPKVHGSKYLQVPNDGRDHASDSWIQWWRSSHNLRTTITKKNFYKRRRSFAKTIRKITTHGKKDFVQSLLAWALVALLFIKYALADRRVSYRGWVLVPAFIWTYFTMILEVRQFTNALHRSPFQPRKYTTLTYHVAGFMLAYAIIAVLDWRSALLNAVATRREIAVQSSITALSLAILSMELFTPQASNFIRKSDLLSYSKSDENLRLDEADHEEGSGDQGRADERTALLGAAVPNASQFSELDEEQEYLAAVGMLPDDDEDSTPLKKEHKAPPPFEVSRSIFSLATFTFMDSFLFRYARTPATLRDVPDLRADDKAASVVLEFRASCKTFPRWLRKKGENGMRKRPAIFAQIIWYFSPLLIQQIAWAAVKPWINILQPIFIKLILTWATDRSRGKDVKAHVALLYVAGLFLSQVANSLAMSRALIIGRRLCIRAKALVIAEVFTKTMRRKDLAGKALVSGENEPSDAEEVNSPKESEEQASAGRVQNLVSVDASRIAEFFAYIHFFVPDGPLTIIIALVMLFNTIGYSAFAALGTMLLLLPLQTTVAKGFMKYQNEILLAADDRLSLTTEIFQAIKAIKFFAWEEKFSEKLEEKRSKELVALRKRVLVWAVGGIFTMFGAPVLISLITFVVHTKVFHQPLDATTAFTALTLFNIIRSPLDQLADQISQLASTLISAQRVDALLEEEETAKYAVVSTPSTAEDPKVGFVNATFTWTSADAAVNDPTIFKLQNLNLRFPLDGLSLVVGPVGSGKSSLLYALLGEMNLMNGSCFLPSPIVRPVDIDPGEILTDSVAFCAQTPWLLNDTIRNNILFGLTYNERRYRQVLYACALLPDLAVLELGDKTQVGEKGTALSGGQKARISLARAVYSSAKVLLLDDVLSAVDTHTAKHLYNNCLTSDKLMRGRTRIIVTHALHLTMPLADYIVALSNGYVAFDGPAQDYVAASGANTPGLPSGQNFSTLSLKNLHLRSFTGQPPMDSDTVAEAAAAAADQAIEQHLPHLLDNPLTEEQLMARAEKQTTGAVGFGVYTFYAAAAGSPFVLASLFGLIGFTEAVSVGANWALRLWASSFDYLHTRMSSVNLAAFQDGFVKSQAMPGDNPDPIVHDPDYYLRLYLVLALSALCLYGGRTLFFLWRGTVASRILYQDIMQSLLNAPVRFYDQTPIGRVMNRLSKDMESVDQEVPAKTMFFVLELFATAAVVIAIAIALPAFLFAGVFISIVYGLLGWLYIASSREMKRIEAVTRSPVYGLVGECLMGVTSIRAYSDSSRFTAGLFDLVDDTNKPFYALWLTNRWLSVRSDLGGAVVALTTGLFIIYTKSVSASLAGFALTYALVMEERILWIVRMYSETQIEMNSVERVREYILDIPQEEPSTHSSVDEKSLERYQVKKKPVEPPAYWPSTKSGIDIENLEVRYSADLAPAIKKLSVHINPSERVAIVGRTGSGKSTLALSFFRFVEASRGSIVIDGIDISTVPLRTLRDRLTIIPQDAALFAGTVRFNLDPFGYFSDAELYDVLKRTNLLSSKTQGVLRGGSGTATPSEVGGGMSRSQSTSSITAHHDGGVSGSSRSTGIRSLDDMVQTGAKNFSAGQRQLLCLARGLLKLRRSNLLVLDESTANLDHDSDVAVQKAIRDELGEGGSGATILCIAHRLHTIIDFDRVLVLSQGEVLEYDTPANLLRRDGGGGGAGGAGTSEFWKLCSESGDLQGLKEIAFAHEKQQAERRM